MDEDGNKSDGFSICVLISGGGTTLRNLIEKKNSGQLDATISHVVSSRVDAGGIDHAREAGIPFTIADYRRHKSPELLSEVIFRICRESGADLIVMGGFLRQIAIPADFENRVINIHPSLIPAFCGKGYYGSKVHQAVIDYGCKLSGCTVHFVDDQFDHGPIIAQRTVDVMPGDDATTLAARVFEQECRLYPEAINAIASGKVKLEGRTVVIS
ncbi:MAG: phosphoribosylglycinamide formyltransferase [Planctomycetota bacterium]